MVHRAETDLSAAATPPLAAFDPRRFLAVLESDWFRLVVALQDRISQLTVELWSRSGLKTLHLPITTSAISSPLGLGSDSKPVEIDLYGVKTYLADSMQFMLEYGCRLCPSGCYYIMPSFRGEAPDATHLCQFYHSEIEVPGGLDPLLGTVEGYLRHLAAGLLSTHTDDLRRLAGGVEHLERMAGSASFARLTFDEAAAFLRHDSQLVLTGDGTWRTLSRAGERRLLAQVAEPLWVTQWDHLAVPFYQAFVDGTGAQARNADLLLGQGEVIGAGERHTDGATTMRALALHQVSAEPYAWYVDLKTHFPLVTSGFGMGIERFLLWVLRHDDIRDLQILPRVNGLALVP